MIDLDTCEIKRYRPRRVVKKVQKPPFVYNPPMFGLGRKDLTGDGVGVSFISSGAPIHPVIKRAKDAEIFCQDCEKYKDNIGISTMMAGVIAPVDNESIIGLAPGVDCYYAKIIDDGDTVSTNSVISSILWSLVKSADIILLPGAICSELTVLHEAMAKAKKAGTIIFSTDEKRIGLSTIYKEAYFVKSSYGERFSVTRGAHQNELKVKIPNSMYYTTYLKNKFAYISKDLLGISLLAGLAAMVKEMANKKSQDKSTDTIINVLLSLSAKNEDKNG